MEKTALLIIDIQKDNISPQGPYPFDPEKTEKLISNVNTLSSDALSQGIPVIFIRQIFSSFLGKLFSRLLLKGVTIAGEPGSDLDERLKTEGAATIDKQQQNAFKGTELEHFLHSRNVEQIYLCGLDGVYCVAETAKGGLSKNFEVTLLDDAIITNKADRWNTLKNSLASQGVKVENGNPFS
ncbi:MAG: cysteine hydrolase [Sneathiellales bacterium]|nr:cysteine hydrolase [Sneathiellales bacterium]